MGVYIYCLKNDYHYQSLIRGRTFKNEWLQLAFDGTVTVKGSNCKGYAWDGCSLKFKIKDIYFGTPEGVLHYGNGQSKTYYASLIHDVFYQFSKLLRPIVRRKEIDLEFYRILRRDSFRFARLYYIAVRLFGWMYW